MKKLLSLLLLVFIFYPLFSQSRQFIGVNIGQLPATSININYQFDYKPYLSFLTEGGYAINYESSYDILGYIISSHCDCDNEYDIDITNGGFLKIGALLNFRKTFEKENYFHIGLFINQSLLHQKGTYNDLHPDYQINESNNVEKTLYIYGLSGYLGYNFRITDKFSSNIGFQLSFASDNVYDIYDYTYFIPGMGRMDVNSVFPMIILNLKYRLK